MLCSKCVQTDVLRSGYPLTRSIEYSTSVRCMGGLWSIGQIQHVPCLGSFVGLLAALILVYALPKFHWCHSLRHRHT